VLGIRRTIIEHRARTTVPPFDPSSRYWREHAAIQPADMIPPPAP
jgi:hypothetical protein